MTDDVNAKVVIDGTQAARSLLALSKNVAELRKTLEGLGIDMATVNRNLDNIESSAGKASRGIKTVADSSRQASSAVKEEAAATDRMNKATASRVKAEQDLARARKTQSNASNVKSWDDEFNAISRGLDNTRKGNESIISQRYALYDVANTYRILGASLAGVGTYVAVMGAKYQEAFSNVKRTMDTDTSAQAIEAIRRSLINLSSQIPLTYQDLTAIAQAGNEMGVPSDKLVHFTEVVAKFSAVAGISAEETSKAFGAIQAQTGLSTDYMENFGASIAKVGIDSNASIPEILSLTREIARSATAAGFTTDQIIGLSGTLASLRIPPERSRGALTTYFETLNKAVAEGGDRLHNFSVITGIATDDLKRMVDAGQGADVFRAFLQGLGDTSTTSAATQALDALGLAQLRVTDTFRGLSSRLDLYDRDQKNANEAFKQGEELQRQYGITLENLSSQFQIFINGVNALVSAVSGGAIPTLTGLFEVINQVVFALANWIENNQFAAKVIAFGVAVATVTGVILIMRSMIYSARAAMLAINAALLQTGGAGAVAAGGMRTFSGAAAGAAGSARAATGAVFGLRGALRALLSSTGIGLLVTLGGTLLGNMADGFIKNDKSAKSATLSTAAYNKAMQEAKNQMSGAGGAADDLSNQLAGGPGGGGGVSGAAQDAAEKVRTLVDYVSDLTGVMKRSSDIRFGSQEAMDNITLKWIALNEKVAEYQAKIRTLTADKSLKQYWLDIANAYDDQIRAGQLREEIAKIDDQLAEANAGASTELRGNSKAAIENRKTMRDLAGSYDDYIAALAAAGASQDEIQNVIRNLNMDFQAQSAQLGYSGADIGAYTARFADLSKIIDQVPRNITIGLDADPAQQALNEFFAKAEEQARQAGSDAGSGYGDGFGGGAGGAMPDFADISPGLEPKQMQGAGRSAGNEWAKMWHDGSEAVFKSLGAGWLWDTLFSGQNDIARGLGDLFANDWIAGASKLLNPAMTPIFDQWAAEGKSRGSDNGTFFGNLFGTNAADASKKAMTDKNPLGSWATDEANRSPGYSSTTGQRIGSGMGDAIKSTLDSINPASAWANAQVNNGNAWNSGSYLGSIMGSGAGSAFSRALDGIFGSIRSVSNTITSTFGNLGGGKKTYSSGGYTGAGHWLEPAGIVHKGEYVIPKKYVDQSTGLPNMSYVASLRNAKAAPAKMGYATGGFVGGGSNVMRLDAHSLQFLANAMSVRIGIGAKEISNASSRGDRANVWAGAN